MSVVMAQAQMIAKAGRDANTQSEYLAACECALRLVQAIGSGPNGWVTMGVGSGDTGLFVYGPYDAIKACQALILANDEPIPYRITPAGREHLDGKA